MYLIYCCSFKPQQYLNILLRFLEKTAAICIFFNIKNTGILLRILPKTAAIYAGQVKKKIITQGVIHL